MMFGAPISIRNWFLWNQIPVTIGNIVAGVFFTAAALYVTYGAKQSASSHAPAEEDIIPAEGDIPFAEANAVTQ
jgi:hypothetical protein